MRILIVSFLFPPYNTIGAVRVGKTAAWLRRFGHDVRVLTAAGQALPADLPLEIPPVCVTATRWMNVNLPVELALGGRRRVAVRGFSAGRGGGSGIRATVGRWFKTLFNVPDGSVGWLPFAVRAGRRLARRWQPDLILASGLPITSLLAGWRLSRRLGVPWVAELRDLGVDSPYYLYPEWRRRWERRLERRALATASALVTVSQPLAASLQHVYDKPTEVVLNGFDPDDFTPDVAPAPGGPVRIVYTGMIYPGKRDAAPLFEAIARLCSLKQHVQVDFYGRYLEAARTAADRCGVADRVEIHEAVPYAQSLQSQQQADALLLLLWNSPQEQGVYTGKLFEYLGARRPILVIGPEENVAARLVRERRAGVVLTDPAAIAEQLRTWIKQKQSGGVPAIPAEASAGLTREEQTRRLEQVLLRACEQAGGRHDDERAAAAHSFKSIHGAGQPARARPAA